MKLYVGPTSTLKIPGERTLIEPFERVSKDIVGKLHSRICIKDSAGEIRFVLEFASSAEQESFCTRIENANFHDSLVIEREEEDENGDIECWEELIEDPLFFAAYVHGPAKTVRTKAPSATE
jgi:hypothetical protein